MTVNDLTISQYARKVLDAEIQHYLKLLNDTDGLKRLSTAALIDENAMRIVAAGIGVTVTKDDHQAKISLVKDFYRWEAAHFDIENAVTAGVYQQLRPHLSYLYDTASDLTEGFTRFDATEIRSHPNLLPVLQRILDVSKADLKKSVGSVSDSRISKPASERIVDLLKKKVAQAPVDRTSTLSGMGVTLEGIVRDLKGRVLFEEIVANALDLHEVTYKRESEHRGLPGVVYDIRPDFVVPSVQDPVAFIEVRKSSTRHASLYAKDKMFSAINWKGRHARLIGVIIVEGEWTQSALQTMTQVFDYVVPLHSVTRVGKILRDVLDGDTSALRWLIEFRITEAPSFSDH